MTPLLPTLALLAATSPGADAWTDAYRSIRRDPPPEALTRDLHYVVSDEERHDLFREAIDGAGGVFVGVGSNQNYLMAGWAQPEVLIIVDFDQVVVDLHKVYRANFLSAETPEQFLRLWNIQSSIQRRVLRQIDRTVRGPAQRERVRAAYETYRPSVRRHLNLVRDRMKELGVPCFLDDQAQYDALRTLFLEDRVRSVRGDFTGKRTLRDIARVLDELELTVQVLYMSNVEQYVGWHRGRFRKNFSQLPYAEEAVVLRTYGVGKTGVDGNYEYYVQPAAAFVDWLLSRRTAWARTLLKTAQPTAATGLFELGLTPNQVVEAPRRRSPAATGNDSDADETGGTRN